MRGDTFVGKKNREGEKKTPAGGGKRHKFLPNIWSGENNPINRNFNKKIW